MCGIAGGCGAQIDRAMLKRMCDTIAYRGPDDEGYYLRDGVALGVRRLSIIDLETGGQPIHNEDETLWLVFNGEIFNYIELRAGLESRGHKFHTKSDTEVIVHLYEEMGERCVEKLNGMFAFTLWDDKAHKLFLARDRLGVKPLYYFEEDGKLVFASETKSILKAGIEPKPDKQAIVDFVTLGYVLDGKTFFEGVRELPPGHYGVFREGQLKVQQYWDLSYREVSRSEEETVQLLRKLLTEAVRIRLRSDVPLGCYLSGGIDSSVIACIAGELLGRSVQSFTAAFNQGPDYDESFYAKLVSQRAHTEYHEVRPDGSDFFEVLEKIMWFMDYPETVGPGMYPQYCVNDLARRFVKVILGGQGGDEIFAGYPWFTNVELEDIVSHSMNPMTKVRAAFAYLKIGKQNNRLLVESKHLLTRLIQWRKFNIEERFYRDRSLQTPEDLSRLFTSEFLAAIGDYSPKESFMKILKTQESDSFMDRSQYYYIKTYLRALLHVEDRLSMAASLESRVPLCCDHNLVEFAATIAPSMRASGAEFKRLLREASKDLMPNEIYERKDKKGFPTPFDVWLREQLSLVRETLLSERAKNRGVFDQESVAEIIEKFEGGSRRQAYTILMMLCVEYWFRQFIDRENVEIENLMTAEAIKSTSPGASWILRDPSQRILKDESTIFQIPSARSIAE